MQVAWHICLVKSLQTLRKQSKKLNVVINRNKKGKNYYLHTQTNNPKIIMQNENIKSKI